MKLRWLLNEVTGNFEIFFDMDGVLVDFEAQMQKYFHQDAHSFFAGNQKDGWERIKKIGGEFWLDMGWLPGSQQVWSLAKKSGCPVNILTAPPKPKNIDMGYIKDVMKWKVQWVRSHLGSQRVLFAYTGHKGKFAKSNRILIDDMDKNIVDWESNGGIAIHFTSPQAVIQKLKSTGVKV